MLLHLVVDLLLLPQFFLALLFLLSGLLFSTGIFFLQSLFMIPLPFEEVQEEFFKRRVFRCASERAVVVELNELYHLPVSRPVFIDEVALLIVEPLIHLLNRGCLLDYDCGP